MKSKSFSLCRFVGLAAFCFVLTLKAQVGFSTQAQNQANYEGRTVSMTVGFTNFPASAPYAVQWQKDGVNLANSTHFQGAATVRRFGDFASGSTVFGRGNLTIPDLRPSDVGVYRAIVHVSGLSATSNPVNVTITSFTPRTPVIRQVANDTTVPVGTAFVTFRTQITASPDTTIQWYKDGIALTNEVAANVLGYYAVQGAPNIDGDSFFDFVVSPVYAYSAGKYKVELKNSKGSAVSREIVLALGPGTGPAFTAQPTPTNIVAQHLDSAMIGGYQASGNPTPVFYLAKNGTPFTQVLGVNYTFNYLQASDSGIYTLIASNSVGQVSSVPISLTVGAPAGTSHTVTPMPLIGSAAQIRGATLNANVYFGTNDHPNPNTYQIQFAATGNSFTIPGGGYLPAQTGTWSLDFSGKDDKGNPLPTININGLKSEDGVSFSNAHFYLFYEDNRLDVWYDQPTTLYHHFAYYSWSNLPALSGAPTISQQPTAKTAVEGSTAVLQVFASGQEPLTFQWQKGGVDIAGATNRALSFTNVATANAGNYRVKITSGSGSTVTSSTAVLTVSAAVPPTFSNSPSDIIGFVDDIASTYVLLGMPTINGLAVYSLDTQLTLEWKKNGTVLKSVSGPFNPMTYNNQYFYPGVMDSKGFAHLLKSDAGDYTAAASVKTSVTNKNFKIVVYDQNDAPGFREGKTLYNLTTGGKGATLVCEVIGVQDDGRVRALINTVTYQWKKNGVPIAGATFPYYDIPAVSADAAGSYTVVATATASNASAESSAIVVKLAEACNLPANAAALPGKSYVLSKSSEGDPWPNGDITIKFAATGSTYEIPATANHAGFTGSYTASGSPSPTITLQSFKFTSGSTGIAYLTFMCNDNAFGFFLTQGISPFASTSGTASTNVPVDIAAPVINTGASNQTVAVGQPATFSILASVSDNSAITYQWFKGVTPISGATTNSYTIPSAALTDAGSFSVVVTANGKSVTNGPVTLTVTGPPDTTAPTIAITAPVANAKLTNATVTVKGTAADNNSVVSVRVRANSGAWISASGTTNWQAALTLVKGTNVIYAYALDSAGNFSATNSVKVICTPFAQLTVTVVGNGTTTPVLNGKYLEVGKTVSLTAMPATGFKFSGWTGGVVTNKAAISFVMVDGMTLTATFVDSQAPDLTVTKPLNNARVTNEVLMIQGTAKDNVGVAAVKYRLNGADAVAAAGTTSWSKNISLIPGTNSLQIFAEDAAGNRSKTNALSVVYAVMRPITVRTNGSGSIAPNLNGQALEVGKTYTLTATPAVGFAFTNWTGTVGTNKAAITFRMVDGMTLTATFVDSQAPNLTVAKPLNNARVTNEVLTIQGTAKDNVGVAAVKYRLNGGEAVAAAGTTSWSKNISLIPGTNSLQIFAEDAAGNRSKTNALAVVYAVMRPITVGTNGNGTIAPNLNGTALEVGKTYTLTATPAVGFAFTNWTGTVGTNKAAITFRMVEGMTLTANFKDIKAPDLVVTKPLTGLKTTNSLVAFQGTAKDNAAVTSVQYMLNNGAWSLATGTTAWSQNINVPAGTNTIRIVAVDAAGNRSKTNSIVVIFTAPKAGLPATDSLELAVSIQDSEIEITFQTQIGLAYLIQTSEDFETWSDAETVVATSAETQFKTSVQIDQTARFYRIIQQR